MGASRHVLDEVDVPPRAVVRQLLANTALSRLRSEAHVVDGHDEVVRRVLDLSDPTLLPLVLLEHTDRTAVIRRILSDYEKRPPHLEANLSRVPAM